MEDLSGSGGKAAGFEMNAGGGTALSGGTTLGDGTVLGGGEALGSGAVPGSETIPDRGTSTEGAAPGVAAKQSDHLTISARIKRLAKRTVSDFFNRDVGTYASSIAFFFFMAMIPLLIILLQMIPLLGLSQANLLDFINKLIPEAAQGFASMVVNEAYKSSRGAVSLSALVLFWAASTATRALRLGLNQVYDAVENRPYPILCLMAIGYTLALIVMFTIMLFMVFAGPVTSYLIVMMPEVFSNPITIEMHDQILITLFMLVIFVMIYTFIPAGRRSFLRQIPGALLVAVLWTVFSKLFAIYVRGSNAYTMFYGSLGGIAILLFWLYCCFYIVLIGAYFNRFCGERWDRVKAMIMRRKAGK